MMGAALRRRWWKTVVEATAWRTCRRAGPGLAAAWASRPTPATEHSSTCQSRCVAAMRILGIWNWLTPAQQTTPFVINGQSTTLEKVARKGQHWMLTPWRNLELVHAVQRPLITPELLKLRIGRGANETFVQPIFTAPCSIASTDRVDLRANWNEPFDDGGGQDPGNHPRIDHAFSIKITDKKSYNDIPEYNPAS